MLQDALSEVTQNLSASETEGFCALLKGRNKELVKMAETVLRKWKKEVEEKGLTENGKEGRSKKITSCKYMEGQLRDCSQIE